MQSHLLQFNWAEKRLKELETEVTLWLDGKHYTLRTKADSEPFWYLLLATAKPIPIDPTALLISEILHSTRCGLDHIAFALACAHTKPMTADIIKNSEFPIFAPVFKSGRLDTSELSKKLQRRIGGVSPPAYAIIEALQPYRRGNDFALDPLWKLNELHRIDKHRLLHPVIGMLGGAMLEDKGTILGRPFLFPRRFEVMSGIMEVNTPVVRYYVPPGHKMNVDFQPSLNVAFPHGSAAAGEEVVRFLTDTLIHIRDNVITPLVPYLP